jgi:predicted nucleotidyltransferase
MDAELRKRIERAAAVLKSFGAREVYVFGSAAAGVPRPGSDVDLAVVGLPPEVFFEATAGAADALGCELDLVDLDEQTPFTCYLREQGELQRVA